MRDQIKTELANLDTDSKGSVFYAAKLIVQDSIMESYKKERARFITLEQANMMRSDIPYTINKNYQKQEISYTRSLGLDSFTYTEIKPFDWKITKETQKIGSYTTQKATLYYGGRTWNVWFTNDIPLQDGPYKFCGLPGLIVKAEDSKGDYQFELVETKKITPQSKTLSIHRQSIKVKRAEYNKVLKRFNEDPIAFFPPPPASTNGITPPSNLSASKSFKEKAIADRKKDNNPIEFN